MRRRSRPSLVIVATVTVSACGGGEPGGSPYPPAPPPTFDRSVLLEDSAATSANVSIGDVDGDGHLDVLLVKGRHWPLHNLVLLGDGAGGFEAPRAVSETADRSYSGVLVDIDGDRDLDVVVSNDDPDRKGVLLNDGTGRFDPGPEVGRPEWSTRHIKVADLDGDGFLDVIFANRTGPPRPDRPTEHNFVCYGRGGGSFADECLEFSDESATTVTPADFDGDGRLDLAVPHREGGQSWIYLQGTTGAFEERVAFGPGDAAIRSAEVADFDGDGTLDIALIDERSGPAVLWGGAGVTFGAPQPLRTDDAPTPYALAVSDVDGDGRPDILVGNVEARPVVWFGAAEPRTFVPVRFGDARGVTYGFAVGDLDEDGVNDIAMARSDAPNVLYFGARGAGRAHDEAEAVLDAAQRAMGVWPTPALLELTADAAVEGPGGPFRTLVRSSSDGRARMDQPQSGIAVGVGAEGGWLTEAPFDTVVATQAQVAVVRGHELHMLALLPRSRLSNPRLLEPANGRMAVALTLETGDSVVAYLDAADTLPSGLLIPTPEGDVRVDWSDWTRVDGIAVFRRAAFRQGGETWLYTYERIDFGPLPDSAFEAPVPAPS